MKTSFKQMIYFILFIVSFERKAISPEEIANELMPKLRLQKFSHNYSLMINNKYQFNITNISPMIIFPTPHFQHKNFFFNDTIVTFIFDLYIFNLQFNPELYYFFKNNFAQCKYDLIFNYHKDNSYELDYKEKSDTFQLSQSPIQNILLFKDALIKTLPEFRRKLINCLDIFIEKQLKAYPLDDCAYRLTRILNMVMQSRQFVAVNILHKYPIMISRLSIDSIIYNFYLKDIYRSCRIYDVVIRIAFYLGTNYFDLYKVEMNVKNIYFNPITVSFFEIDPHFNQELASYIQKQFEKYSNETHEEW